MLQILCTLLIFLLIMFPIGRYVYHISTMQKTFADPVFNKIDSFLYKILGIDKSNMGWKKYVLTLLLVNAFFVFFGYVLLRIQSINFFNPNDISNMEESLSLNTIISFMTNSN